MKKLRMWKNTGQNNSEYGHFLGSDTSKVVRACQKLNLMITQGDG